MDDAPVLLPARAAAGEQEQQERDCYGKTTSQCNALLLMGSMTGNGGDSTGGP